MAQAARHTLAVGPEVEQILKALKKKNPDLFREVEAGVNKLLRSPESGKPLRNILRNCRRIHIASSFVLLYEIKEMTIILLDFDHHDKIYKKK